MTKEEKRKKDAEITKKFLQVNTDNVRQLVAECIRMFNGLNDAGEYYLKGGNAFDLLKGNVPSGDWDFQFKPNDVIYGNWEQQFPALDERIKTGLVNLAQTRLNWNTAYQGAAIFALQPANEGEVLTGGFLCGPRYRIYKHHQIDRLKDPESQRIKLDPQDITHLPVRGAGAGPVVYVNYTIAGFILYRLVYAHHYQVGGEKFMLKSEIIDISVPRPGSAEVHLSQEGVITHFREVDANGTRIRIPGWGYHFYENLNLLQEIRLGTSGSPHKKKKRSDRGNEALNKLILANETDNTAFIVCTDRIKEEPAGAPLVTSFLNAILYNVPEIDIKKDLYEFLFNRYETLEIYRKKRPIQIEHLADFDCDNSKNMKVGDVQDTLRSFLVYCNLATDLPPKDYKLKSEYECRIFSPLNELNREKPFALLFVALQINQTAFDRIREVSRTTNHIFASGHSFEILPASDDLIIVKYIKSGVKQGVRFYFRQRAWPAYNINDFLSDTLIESQREGVASTRLS